MSHLFDLTGKTAIVTGASRGLGKSLAQALAQAGADLAVTSRRRDALQEVEGRIRQLGRRVLPLELNVLSQEDIQQLVEAVLQEFGKIDILVNNAGLNIRRPSTEVSWEDWDTVLDTNLKGSFFCARAVAPHMIDRRYGRIINVGSCTAVFGMEGIVPYAASRGGVLQMTRSLAAEWGRYGVTVNVLAPGFFETAQTAALYANREWVESILERIPLGRTGRPGDLDGAVVFLASDASEYVTGQILFVDGGFTTGATRAIVSGPKA